MKKAKVISVVLLITIIISLICVGCQKDEEETLSKYLYNSSGECIAHYHNGYLYDENANDALAKYDSTKKVFYDDDGYFGEVYQEKYLVYNTNSPYVDYEFGYMPIAPFAPYTPYQANIATISLPSGYYDFLTIKNTSDFMNIQVYIDGYAAFYVYLVTVIEIDPHYMVRGDITVKFTLTMTYKGYLKTDYTLSQSKTFTNTISITASTNKTNRDHIYESQHNDYGFFTEISKSIVVTSVQGIVIKTMK